MVKEKTSRKEPIAPIAISILGFIVGVSAAEFLGGVVGGTIGYLLGTVRRLAWRLDVLERANRGTESAPIPSRPRVEGPVPSIPPREQAAAAPDPASPPTPLPSTPGVPDVPTAADQRPVELAAASAPKPEPKVIPTPLPPDPPVWRPPPPEVHSSSDLQRLAETVQARVVGFFTTGNVVAKVGAVILFFGLAFLVRYATRQLSLPIELRMAGVGLAGLALLGLGWRLRHRPDAYGLILQGAGAGVLYLTIFASARLYGLIPLLASFGLLIALVAVTCVLATRQDSQALAVLALSGGFLTPVLTSTGSGNHVGLFTFYALLNAGIFAMAWFRAWRGLNLLGFVFTFAIGTLWGVEYYTPAHFASTQPFLVLFFLFYVAVAVLFTRKQATRWHGLIDGGLVFGTPAIVFALQATLVRDLPHGLAYSAAALAFVYLGLTGWLARQGALTSLLGQSFLGLGIVFASLTLPFAFANQQWTAAGWALAGAGLLWVGVRQGQLLPRVFGLLLQTAAPVAFLVGMGHARRLADDGLTVTIDLIGLGMLAVAAFFSAYALARPTGRASAAERLLRWPFLAWGMLTWFIGGAIGVDRYLPDDVRFSALVLLIALSSAALTRLAVWRGWHEGRTPGWLLLPTSALLLAGMAAFGIQGPLRDLGWLAWPVSLAITLWQLRVDERSVNAPRLPRLLAAATHAGTLLMVAWLAAWTVSAAITLDNPLWRLVAWGLVPAVIAFGVQRFAPRPRWPVGAHREAYVGTGLLPMMFLLLLWTLGSNASAGDAAPLPYVPILNPLDVSQALVLLTVAAWCRRQAAFRLAGYQHLALASVATTAFVWLTAVTARFVHWTFDVPYRIETLVASPIFQTALSILWTVLAIAAMITGSRQGARPRWIIGATLLGVVVLKLALIDLSSSGTLARIVSFLSVGGLMLAVGFLAPLPPRMDDARGEPDEAHTDG